MAAGATYTPIATTTANGSTNSYTFNSFSGYTDLKIIILGGASSGGNTYNMIFNSDTGTNYSQTELWGNGTSASSNRRSSQTSLFIGGSRVGLTSAIQNLETIDVFNYANTTTYKTILNRQNDAAQASMAVVGLWRSTSAITSLTITSDVYNFTNGSTITLYGIVAA